MAQGKKLTPQQLERALDLSDRGWTEARIAPELGVARSTLSRRLAPLLREAMEQFVADRAAAQGRLLGSLQWIVSEALGAWESTRAAPDPRLLREAREALAAQRKLLSLDEPKRAPEPDGDVFLQALEESERIIEERQSVRPSGAETGPGAELFAPICLRCVSVDRYPVVLPLSQRCVRIGASGGFGGWPPPEPCGPERYGGNLCPTVSFRFDPMRHRDYV
jgi:hypothetical protein